MRACFSELGLCISPFFTSGVEGSDIETAERKNAYSMALTVRGVVELFMMVGREVEVLGWSVAYDERRVRICGHYAEFEGRGMGKEIKYYSHEIRSFDFTIIEGKERWTAYRFVRNLYEVWVPRHFERLCEVVDQIPEGFDLGQDGKE
ncbi:reverse transcriptase protein [Rutstroemia sp. NJR-2017a WRK4]|nr:reverse transcriptase protein [Rutstroemia sp. NJR-2017a WRK4]